MILRQIGLSSLVTVLFFSAGQAQAWSCVPIGELIVEDSEQPLFDEEILRRRSKGIAGVIGHIHSDGDIIVVGQFSRNATVPFLHEQQLEGIRANYWPPSEDVQMPYHIEYTYIGAYSFRGRQIIDATLSPFSAESVDARVSITADYEGVVDQLPATDMDVIGILRSSHDGRRIELTTSICPSYYQIEPTQLADLIDCYRDGACR